MYSQQFVQKFPNIQFVHETPNTKFIGKDKLNLTNALLENNLSIIQGYK